jgi:hypothetical protein
MPVQTLTEQDKAEHILACQAKVQGEVVVEA